MTVIAPSASNERGGGVDLGLAQDGRCERRRGDPDRRVDPQHPLPPERLRDHAAEQAARRAAAGRDRAPHAQRRVALGAFGERRRDEAERGGGEDRGAEALQRASGDQRVAARRQPARERRDREER